jgi:hypothetical protein
MQTKPQLMPSHVAVAWAGGTHAVHDAVPHEVMLVLLAHVAPHRWNPGSHMMPHVPPEHVADPDVGTGQLVPHVPQ